MKNMNYTVNVLNSDETEVLSVGVSDFTLETIRKAWDGKLLYKNAYVKDCDNKNIIETNNLENEEYSFIKFFDIQTDNIYYYFLTK